MVSQISPILNPRTAFYLSFSEVSGVSGVSKSWRATADKCRNEMVQSGMNTGFLYKMFDRECNSGYLYVDKSGGRQMNVLTLNPLLHAAFSKAESIALSEESIEELRTLMMDGSEKLQSCLQQISANALCKMHESLINHLQQNLSACELRDHRVRIDGKNKSHQVLLSFAECFLAIMPRTPISVKSLKIRVQEAHKNVIDLNAHDQDLDPMLFCFKICVDLMVSYPKFLEYLANDIGGFTQGIHNRRLAWQHGHSAFYDMAQLPISASAIIKDTFIKADLDAKQANLIKALERKKSWLTTSIDEHEKRTESQKPFPKEEFDALEQNCHDATKDFEIAKQVYEELLKQETQNLDKLTLRFNSQFARYIEKVAERIEKMLPQTSSPLVILPILHEDIIEQLKKRGIGVVGPLIAPLKPRGFLWKLTNPQGKSGHLVGSIHFTPANLLNFNRAMTDAFNESGILAVEVEQSKAFEESMSFETNKHIFTEIQALPQTTKNKLIALFKERLNSSQSDIGAPEDPELFLPWMVRLIMPATLHQLDMSKGIDHRFIELARDQNKPIVGLEDIALHSEHAAQLMTGITGVDRKILSELAEGTSENFDQMLYQFENQLKHILNDYAKKWEFGLVEELEDSRKQQPPSFDTAIMKMRNQIMANSVVRFIESGCNPFSVVGLNHTQGDDSMLKILQQQQNYRVQQIMCEQPEVAKLLKMCKAIAGGS